MSSQMGKLQKSFDRLLAKVTAYAFVRVPSASKLIESKNLMRSGNTTAFGSQHSCFLQNQVRIILEEDASEKTNKA